MEHPTPEQLKEHTKRERRTAVIYIGVFIVVFGLTLALLINFGGL